MCIEQTTVSFSSMPHARRLQNAPDYRRPVSRWGGDNAATMSMFFCIPLYDTRTLNSWRTFLSTPGTAFRTRRCHFELFYNLCSPLENRSTSSVACAPDFWIKSGFWSLALIDSSVSQETGRFELLLDHQRWNCDRAPEPDQTDKNRKRGEATAKLPALVSRCEIVLQSCCLSVMVVQSPSLTLGASRNKQRIFTNQT